MQDADGPFSLTECLIYIEHHSKNRPGGSKQLDLAKRLRNTFRMHNCTSQEVSWCFKVCLTKTASIVNGRDFKAMTYILPEVPWYDNQPDRHNVLKGKLREMFQSAVLQAVTKYNHSLHTSGISWLYSEAVPEMLIMERALKQGRSLLQL